MKADKWSSKPCSRHSSYEPYEMEWNILGRVLPAGHGEQPRAKKREENTGAVNTLTAKQRLLSHNHMPCLHEVKTFA